MSEESEENPLEGLEESVEELGQDVAHKLLEALAQKGMRLTHVVAVCAYTGPDAQGAETDYIAMHPGPDQPSWLSKALLEKGLEKWNEEDAYIRQQRMINAAYEYEIDEEDEDE